MLLQLDSLTIYLSPVTITFCFCIVSTLLFFQPFPQLESSVQVKRILCLEVSDSKQLLGLMGKKVPNLQPQANQLGVDKASPLK